MLTMQRWLAISQPKRSQCRRKEFGQGANGFERVPMGGHRSVAKHFQKASVFLVTQDGFTRRPLTTLLDSVQNQSVLEVVSAGTSLPTRVRDETKGAQTDCLAGLFEQRFLN